MSETESELLALTQRLLESITNGDWATYQELCDPTLTAYAQLASAGTSIVSTLLTMIVSPSRHAHSVRVSLVFLAITMALNGSGRELLHAYAPMLGVVETS